MMFEDVNVSNRAMIDLVYCHRNYKRMTKTLDNLCTIQIVKILQCKSGFQGSIIRYIKIHRSVKMSGQEVFVKVGHMCIHIYIYIYTYTFGDDNPTDQLKGGEKCCSVVQLSVAKCD